MEERESFGVLDTFLKDYYDYQQDPLTLVMGVTPATQSLLQAEDVNEGQLLAETEDLLNSLDAAAFVLPLNHTPTDKKSTVQKKNKKKEADVPTSPCSATDSANAPVRRPTSTAERCNAYRKRMKSEMIYLRQTVADLEAQVSTLQAKRDEEGGEEDSSGDANGKVDENGALIVPSWQAVAKRQLEARLQAERENQELKGALDAQIELAQQLQETIRKRPKLLALRNETDANTQPKQVRLDAEDMRLFDSYLAELDDIHARTEDVFVQCGVDLKVEESFEMNGPPRYVGDRAYFELVNLVTMPFNFQNSRRAMWQALVLLGERPDRVTYLNVSRPEDTIAYKIRVPCSLNDKMIPMIVRMVMRRYDTEDRTIVVWRALTEREDKLSGMQADETGWSVRRAIVNVDGSTTRGTMKQTVVQVYVGGSKEATQSEKVEEFSKLVMDSSEGDEMEMTRMMENMLLDEIITSK